jgi:hypothetical protein
MRSPLDYLLAACGTGAGIGCAYYLLKHGFDGPDTFATPLLFSVPAGLAALTGLFFASLLVRSAAKAVLVGLLVLGATATFATEVVLSFEGLASSSRPLWSFDSVSPAARQGAAELARSFGVKVDARDRSEKVEELRGRGVDAVPGLMLADILGADSHAETSDDRFKLIPIGGISNALTVLCNETGQFVTYTSDEHGLRNPPGVWTAPRADLAAVGQSLVQGFCVADGQGFVDLLRARYPVTLNLGISGESALLQLAAIREYLPPLQPKIVLWFFTEGQDLNDLYEESRHPLVKRYLEPTFTQNLPSRQAEIDHALRRSQAEQRSSPQLPPSSTSSAFFYRSLGMLKLWHVREKLDLAYGINGVDRRAWSALTLLDDTLTRADNLARSWGGRLYFVYLPSWTRYRNGSIGPERERTAVLSVVESLRIPIIDLEPVFRGQEDPLSLFPFRRFGHYNEAGNRIVAATVLKTLSPGSGDEHVTAGSQ